ncbi:MAG: type II secretion system protein [Candidatus Omnitrophota bacterium]
MKKRFSKGFTLLEILIVIAILGVLLAIAAATMGRHVEKAEQKRVEQDLNTLASVITTYYSTNRAWPGAGNSGYDITTAAQWQTLIDDGWLKTMPKDPWGNVYYFDGNPSTESGEGCSSIYSIGPNKTDDAAGDKHGEGGDDIVHYLN